MRLQICFSTHIQVFKATFVTEVDHYFILIVIKHFSDFNICEDER